MKKCKYAFLVVILIFVSSCEEDNDPQDSFENLDYFYSSTGTMRVDVAYEPGAEPYTNTGFGSNNNFEFTLNNLNNLFSGRINPILVTTDIQLSDMTLIPAQNKRSFTQTEILQLATDYQGAQSTANQGVILVIYLDGYFNLNGQEKTNVLGVSVGSFTVAIFKPVITAIPGGGLLGADPKYQVEQATVVHEVGHAIGLVDNGVALHTDHLDEANGKHCDNTNCVMYWANEGASGASSLFGGASISQLVFGQECIADISNY
jgi:predicted Zn-dependent protease